MDGEEKRAQGIDTCRSAFSAAAFLAVVREPIDASWRDYLGDVQFVVAPGGNHLSSTVVTGVVPDFAAFVGLIGRLQNLGLTVLSISFNHLQSGPA